VIRPMRERKDQWTGWGVGQGNRKGGEVSKLGGGGGEGQRPRKGGQERSH
jgi:hypothetical protein